jgi:hypothetical protein
MYTRCAYAFRNTGTWAICAIVAFLLDRFVVDGAAAAGYAFLLLYAREFIRAYTDFAASE